jgi:L-lactate dehydrogenase
MSRLDLAQVNIDILKSITPEITKYAPDATYIIVSNPVDVLTYVFCKISGIPEERIIGSGTILDTARLRAKLSKLYGINERNVHAYVMGEHGDSEFTPWSQALISTKPVLDIIEDNPHLFTRAKLDEISENVKYAAHAIIAAKGSTYYGIGMAAVRIVRAILSHENSVLTVSSLLNGEYGQKNVFCGNPCIINRYGISRKIELSLTDEELKKLDNSCNVLRNCLKGL